jgi:integrase
MAEARKLPERSRAPYRGLVYETIFALLYGLGLWVGEVPRLKMGDADFTRNLLFIRETKFAKSRYVPNGTSSGAAPKRLRGRTVWKHASCRIAHVHLRP